MRCTIPEISWHNRDPVLSIDIQQIDESKDFYRLASGGTDSHVLIWYVRENDNSHVNLELVADLTRHQRAVNCVRWSPSSEFLASCDDESVIFIWKLKSDTETINILDNINEQDKEIWLTFKILRGHMEDVYDLSWSANSVNLISGSVDNTAIVWDIIKGKSVEILSKHKSFVQGVAWDPKNEYLVTLCADRYMRVFDVETRKIISSCSKSSISMLTDPSSIMSETIEKIFRLYHDDTLQTFYRRLAFSPDGEILICPSGVLSIDDEKSLHTSYVYTRYDLKKPSVVLPSPEQYTVAIRFCPLLFQLHKHNESNPPVINLPYRMIFAVASKSSVYLYDTQQKMPFGVVSNIHYTRLTDLTWSSNARLLLVSSTDGFCTLITFAENELGIEYISPNSSLEINENIQNFNGQLVDDNSSINLETMQQEQMMSKLVITTQSSDPTKPYIQIDIPETIISSEEKFKSPNLKNKPATPIQIRREPLSSNRMGSVSKELTYNAGNEKVTPLKSTSPVKPVNTELKDVMPSTPLLDPSTEQSPKRLNTPHTRSGGVKNKANPIAVRRKPRVLLTTPSKTAKQQADISLGVWPIEQSQQQQSNQQEKSPLFSKTTPRQLSSLQIIDVSMDIDDSATENIRLVYEDDDSELTSDDSNADVSNANTVSPEKSTTTNLLNSTTPTSKTPRRVQLRTLSTPKGKK